MDQTQVIATDSRYQEKCTGCGADRQVLDSTASLRKLKADTQPLVPVSRRFVLRLPAIPESEWLSYENRINKYANDCGCDAGAISAVATALAFGIYCLIAGYSMNFSWALLWWLFPAFFVGGLIGKSVALIVSSTRLRWLIDEIVAKTEHFDASHATNQPGSREP